MAKPKLLTATLAALVALTLAGLAGCARKPTQGDPAPLPTAQRVDAGTYELNTLPGQILLHGGNALFTASGSPSVGSQRIYRLDLQTSQVQEVVASRFYPDGVLDSYRLGLAGGRLIYLEISTGSSGPSWTLAGHSLADGTATVIDQATGDRVSWPGPDVAANGDWVVWVRKEGTEAQPRSVIRARNLVTGEDKRLGDALDASREAWAWPNLQGNLLVVERDHMGEHGALSDVYLIDLVSGAVTPLSESGQASEPCLDGRYVAWKAAPRFGQGPLALYDLQTRELRTLDVMVEYPHSSEGQVLAWSEGKGLVRVDAASGEYAILVQAESASGFRPAPEVSLDGRRIAWLEWSAQGGSQPQARLHVQG